MEVYPFSSVHLVLAHFLSISWYLCIHFGQGLGRAGHVDKAFMSVSGHTNMLRVDIHPSRLCPLLEGVTLWSRSDGRPRVVAMKGLRFEEMINVNGR